MTLELRFNLGSIYWVSVSCPSIWAQSACYLAPVWSQIAVYPEFLYVSLTIIWNLCSAINRIKYYGRKRVWKWVIPPVSGKLLKGSRRWLLLKLDLKKWMVKKTFYALMAAITEIELNLFMSLFSPLKCEHFKTRALLHSAFVDTLALNHRASGSSSVQERRNWLSNKVNSERQSLKQRLQAPDQ